MFRDKMDQIDRLLTLPQIVNQINELMDSPTASAADLHRVIKADPALSSKLLKLVNSAYYGLPGRVGSLERALVLLGINAVKNLAIAAGIERVFRGLKFEGPYSGGDLWKHCLAVACGARVLGQHAGMAHLDEVFMAGLIHDLGLLAAAQTSPKDFVQVMRACMGSQTPWAVAELEILGIQHSQGGAYLADRWHFPPYLVEMVADHHDWPDKPAGSDLAGIVYVADTLACGLGDGFAFTAQHQTISPEMLERLGLSQDVVEELWRDLPAHVEELSCALAV